MPNSVTVRITHCKVCAEKLQETYIQLKGGGMSCAKCPRCNTMYNRKYHRDKVNKIIEFVKS